MKRLLVWALGLALAAGVAARHVAHPDLVGVQFRLLPSLAFLLMGIVGASVHRSQRGASICFCVALMAVSALTCSLLRHELALIYLPSVFVVPPLLCLVRLVPEQRSVLPTSKAGAEALPSRA